MSDPALIARAYSYAAKIHTGQLHKVSQGNAYINHVTEVAELVAVAAGHEDENMLAANLLYDVIEDSDATANSMTELFGENFTKMVVQLTDPKAVSETARRRAQFEHARHLCGHAKFIKVADKISNLAEMRRDPPANWSIEQRQAYLDWSEAVFVVLVGENAALDEIFRDTADRLRMQLTPIELRYSA